MEDRTHINPEAIPAAVGGYSHGVVVGGNHRTLYVSGQTPENRDGEVPAGFEAQCEQVWVNIEDVLTSAGMSVGDIVKVNTFLTSRDQADTNSVVRRRYLGDHLPALTVVVIETLNPEWLLEIEVVAASENILVD